MHALHGFLGRPTDWNFLPFEVKAHDLFAAESIGQKDFFSWPAWFNSIASGSLIGYSMGARLALMALHDKPENWKSAILISPHLGIEDRSERLSRLSSDFEWAGRFLKLPWDELIKLWEAQAIFDGGPRPERIDEIPREFLASALFKWSLALQPLMDGSLEHLQMPLLLVYGERETAHVLRAKKLKLAHPKSKIWIAPDSPHRIPWAAPKALIREIEQFQEEIER